ncbi:ribosome-associated translation inhibitor RaiA [Candidatus Wolfebacteria bacterium]|nr:ribosome-associated translation inhibitor RaiA [Candidatus Wolfebacteria bacterium]
MKINLKATNLDLTPAIREYLEKRIGSLEKFVKRFEIRGEVKLEVEIARTARHHRKGNVFYAEVNLHLPKKILRAEHSDADIRAAIDKVKDKLKMELVKYKGLSRNFRD